MSLIRGISVMKFTLASFLCFCLVLLAGSPVPAYAGDRDGTGGYKFTIDGDGGDDVVVGSKPDGLSEGAAGGGLGSPLLGASDLHEDRFVGMTVARALPGPFWLVLSWFIHQPR